LVAEQLLVDGSPPEPYEVETGEAASVADFLAVDPEDDTLADVDYMKYPQPEAALLVDYDAAGIMGEYADPQDVQPAPADIIEFQETPDESPEVSIPLAVEEVVLYLESLEPARAEAAEELITAFSAAVKDSQRLPVEASTEQKEAVEEELEALCVQLFECLGIDYDDETIKLFIENMRASEPAVDRENVEMDAAALSTEVLNRKGTYEYKPLRGSLLLTGLTRFIKEKTWPSLMMGRYALWACSI
jgi:hypothetical protein